MYSTIRFVGGPWHNQFHELELCPEIVLRHPEKVAAQSSLSWAGCFASQKEDRYYLARYQTSQGTEYYQYVHKGLVRNGEAAYSTYRERLPVWRIDRRQLEARLRRAAGCLLKKRR